MRRRLGSPERHAAPLITTDLELETLERGRVHRLVVDLVEDAVLRPIGVPVLVARGREPGPVVGVTAAVHGNELNGIPTIHRLFAALRDTELRGSVVAVPIVNVPGYLRHTREFNDGADLNRIMPGDPDGTESDVFAHRFLERVVRHFDYLVDLHTASFGRVNSLYVRADLHNPTIARMARLIGPQLIVHNEGKDGTLRAAADDMGIPTITVEVGDPQRFQRGLIRSSRLGIQALLADLGMTPAPEVVDDDDDDEETIECARSYWLYTDVGGVLEVFGKVADRVTAGEQIAVVRDVYGDVTATYDAPEDGVIVGKSTNPVAQTGARILHLGIPGRVKGG